MDKIRLLEPLPPDRTFEQVKNHYLVEKAIAQKLKKSSREERMRIYAAMYAELFSKVPDHPRLARRESPALTARANKDKLSMLKKFLAAEALFLEFAPGDCKCIFEIAPHVQHAYGVDISDQRNPADCCPDNFSFIIYDGYTIDKIESGSIDLVFSDQLIEHFHPEDTRLHFELVYRILKPGGRYVFRTPHSLNGPHDVSRYFSDNPECFHLKEWTYTEINQMLLDIKYSRFYTYWNAKGIHIRIPYIYFLFCESVVKLFPIRRRYLKYAATFLIPSLCGVAVK